MPGKAIGRGLHLVGKLDAELTSVTQEALEIGKVRRRRDDEYVANARHHERGKRIVNHWLVIDWQKLLARNEGERIQAAFRYRPPE